MYVVCEDFFAKNATVRVELKGVDLNLEGRLAPDDLLVPFNQWLGEHDLEGVSPELVAQNLYLQVHLSANIPVDLDVAVGVSSSPNHWVWFRP